MMPTARLDQSRFEDTDLWLADTFGHAAQKARIKRIVYLGGLIPSDQDLSIHLDSRKEVEAALGAHGVPVISLRAGLILGAEGSSFQILSLLVKRLPLLVAPRWASTPMQPIALSDVIKLLGTCLEDESLPKGSYDIGGPEVTTYRELMLDCAAALGLRRHLISAPYFAPRLSTLWVCLFTGASARLVSPLVRSLGTPMIVTNPALLERWKGSAKTIRNALAECLQKPEKTLRVETQQRKQERKQEPDVRSIQRFNPPKGWTPRKIACAYFEWVDSLMRPLIRVEQTSEGRIEFVLRLFSLRFQLLELRSEPPTSDPLDPAIFKVVGGWLLHPRSDLEKPGVLEFRRAPDESYALAGLHGFRPRLPGFSTE